MSGRQAGARRLVRRRAAGSPSSSSARCGRPSAQATLGPAARHHRRRQDLRRVARRAAGLRVAAATSPAASGRRPRRRSPCCGSRPCARLRPTRCAPCSNRSTPSAPRCIRGARARAAATPRRPSAARRTSACPRCSSPRPKACRCCSRAPMRREVLGHVQMAVVDEWHELLGNKRGVQVQLALARLQALERRLSRSGACRPRWAICMRRCMRCWGMKKACSCRGRCRRSSSSIRCCPARPSAFRGVVTSASMLPQVIERDCREQDRAGLHQHPLAGRDLVPGDARSPARVGRPHRAAPRLARPRSARVGRAGPEERRAEGGGVHVEPGPGRRLPAGRARAADRLAQGRGAAAAARGPLGPCAGAAVAHHAGAHAQRRDGGRLGSARGDCGGPHRGAAFARPAARRAGAAPGDGGAGRWLRARRPVRRGARHGRVRRPLARELAVVPRTSSRKAAHRSPAYPDYQRAVPDARRRLARARCAARAAASHEHRHHRERREHVGAVPAAARRSAASKRASSRA